MVEPRRVETRPASAQIHESTRDHAVISWGNLVCTVFKRQTTLGAVRTTELVYDAVAVKYAGGVYMLMIVEGEAMRPVVEVRDALATFLSVGAGRTRMSAVVHEGTGFHAAMVRSVFTQLAMGARLPYPHKACATSVEAAHWFGTSWYGTRGENGLDPEGLVAALADARERALKMPSSASPLGI